MPINDHMPNPFINFSNHPSTAWTSQQFDAALQYGPVIDLPFLPVDPFMNEEDLSHLAEVKVGEILALKPAAVMCQGEFGFKLFRNTKAAPLQVSQFYMPAASEMFTSKEMSNLSDLILYSSAGLKNNFQTIFKPRPIYAPVYLGFSSSLYLRWLIKSGKNSDWR